MKEDALFCVGQKAFIEKDNKVLILNDPGEGLDFPGGKIQEGEAEEEDDGSLTRALQREVTEETGLEIEVGNPFTVWYHVFPKHHRNYGKVVYLIGFKCKYISGDPKLSGEHDKYRWVDKNNYHEVEEDSGYFRALKKYFLEQNDQD